MGRCSVALPTASLQGNFSVILYLPVLLFLLVKSVSEDLIVVGQVVELLLVVGY